MIPTPPEPMTIEQLKAHMDRRFDRLERTKADRTELRRLAARCATKADLKRFATKEDLRRLERRLEQRFATKDDFRKRFATKDELKAAFGRLEDRIAAMQTMLQRVADHHDRILNNHEARIADLERRA
jgi:hypothetical protein